ncbi:MAG TPA: hypothetical protein VK881_09285 [bacterium]|nr:hypothetical protein [bacterium]
MELLTADEGGEVVIYECPECGYQIEAPVESEDEEPEDRQEPEGDEKGEDEIPAELLEPEEDA